MMKLERAASTRKVRPLSRLRGRHRRPTAAVLDLERRCKASALVGVPPHGALVEWRELPPPAALWRNCAAERVDPPPPNRERGPSLRPFAPHAPLRPAPV